ncbi:hypothetical protein [Nocardia sp. NPDC052566]|uniref:hypothetical protein n=1 Tax=Nocardia sp. NPDC052566 TaxID=3364330 RepID=UPI0037C82393
MIDTAPQAPTVDMTGPHTEIGASVDGGPLLPGFAANSHHFSNPDGYVGTVAYRLPTGIGEAGAALDFTETDSIKVTAFARGAGTEDTVTEFVIGTAQLNAMKASVEQWIRLQPGGPAILAEAARLTTLPEGELPTQSVNVGGATAQWAASVERP